jgi:crotonobetainyl-CoA:carnitine CoA-transferase CaiB-like acyl-CoA transferase
MFERFAHLIGRPELAAPDRFGTIRQRLQHRAEVDALVADWTSLRDRDDILRLCETAQVPCGNLMSIDEIFADPHYKDRGNLVSVDVDGLGEIPVPNVVPRLSSTPGAVSSAGPTLGAHNDEIYRGLLGLSHARLEELQAAGVI